MAPVTLAYWNIRGLAQPIRLLLEYTSAEWEDKYYAAETTPPYSKESWFKEKFTHGLDFPNLPYFVDGDLKISQSKAILRHLARKNNLVGENEKDQVRIEMVEGEIGDFNSAWVNLCYSPNFVTAKDIFLEALPKKLESFSKFFGDGKWIVGDKLTYVDFLFYEVLDQILTLEPNALKEFKNLENFHERFESLEKISAYRSSPRFLKFPVNNPHAKFGGAGVSA